MPEGNGPARPEPSEVDSTSSSGNEHIRPLATRRDFLVGAGAGAVAVGVVAGGIAVTRGGTQPIPAPAVQTGPGGPAVAVPAPPVVQPAAPGQQPAQPAQPAPAQLPATMRRVALDIDGVQRDVVVDVRESLWETMTNKLGAASSNLGCDRAQCGACTVLVDGRAVNGCTVLSARLGRGQKILSVNGLTQGPGPEGLHPVQRAFWLEGGFQCGICTRGFIMSSYALLQTTKSPTDEQIADALGGNICRCGEYTKIYKAVQVAAADMRGEKVTYTAPPIVVVAAKPAAAAGAAGGRASKEFVFTTAFSTIEEFEPFANKVKEKGAGAILEASGSERTITVTWDPGKLDENAVRQMLAETGKTVNP